MRVPLVERVHVCGLTILVVVLSSTAAGLFLMVSREMHYNGNCNTVQLKKKTIFLSVCLQFMNRSSSSSSFINVLVRWLFALTLKLQYIVSSNFSIINFLLGGWKFLTGVKISTTLFAMHFARDGRPDDHELTADKFAKIPDAQVHSQHAFDVQQIYYDVKPNLGKNLFCTKLYGGNVFTSFSRKKFLFCKSSTLRNNNSTRLMCAARYIFVGTHFVHRKEAIPVYDNRSQN